MSQLPEPITFEEAKEYAAKHGWHLEEDGDEIIVSGNGFPAERKERNYYLRKAAILKKMEDDAKP